MPQWFALKMPCPISGCSNSAKGKALILDWVCAADGTTMYICEEGRLRCGSYQHDNKVVNWKFDCGDRSGVHKNEHHQYPDFEGFNYAMSAAIAQQHVSGADWAIKLIKELQKQFGGS